MVTEDYQIAYRQVLEILKHIPANDYEKIPEKRLRLFEKYAKKDMEFYYDTTISFEEQNISEKTKILIAMLYRDYWATEKQKNMILENEKAYLRKVEQEKSEKYKTKNIFTKQEVETKKDEPVKNVELEKYSESAFRKFINKLKRIFSIG